MLVTDQNIIDDINQNSETNKVIKHEVAVSMLMYMREQYEAKIKVLEDDIAKRDSQACASQCNSECVELTEDEINELLMDELLMDVAEDPILEMLQETYDLAKEKSNVAGMYTTIKVMADYIK